MSRHPHRYQELELQESVNHHFSVGFRNQTPVLYKGSKFSQPLSHFLNPQVYIFGYSRQRTNNGSSSEDTGATAFLYVCMLLSFMYVCSVVFCLLLKQWDLTATSQITIHLKARTQTHFPQVFEKRPSCLWVPVSEGTKQIPCYPFRLQSMFLKRERGNTKGKGKQVFPSSRERGIKCVTLDEEP